MNCNCKDCLKWLEGDPGPRSTVMVVSAVLLTALLMFLGC